MYKISSQRSHHTHLIDVENAFFVKAENDHRYEEEEGG
jgi:hypothetical protein